MTEEHRAGPSLTGPLTPSEYRDALERRLATRPESLLHARTCLRHFALITYDVDPTRIAQLIPTDRFAIATFPIAGQARALISAVPFLDVDFHFVRASMVRMSFGQTNYRAYVIDRRTGQHAVWFFGTTLGSPIVHAPVALWRIPWHYAEYRFDCRRSAAGRYERYVIETRSAWGSARIQIDDPGEPFGLQAGFESLEEQALILTHPVDGYFYRTDRSIGTYSVWHDVIPLTTGRASHLFFQVFEDLGLLTREQMLRPHSIAICPETSFEILLPPRRLARL